MCKLLPSIAFLLPKLVISKQLVKKGHKAFQALNISKMVKLLFKTHKHTKKQAEEYTLHFILKVLGFVIIDIYESMQVPNVCLKFIFGSFGQLAVQAAQFLAVSGRQTCVRILAAIFQLGLGIQYIPAALCQTNLSQTYSTNHCIF